MTLRDASYLALETAINQYLSLDPEISQELASLHGSIIGFDLSGTGIQLYFIPDQNGQLQLLSQIDGEPDCLVRGSPVSLLRSHSDESAEQVFSGQIEIIGNSAMAHKFTAILNRIDVDWEELLSKITGDIVANQIGSFFRQTGNWFNRNRQSAQLNLQEYLQEEARLLPGVYELENFYSDVDKLRDDTERLAARIARLATTRSNNS